MNLKELIEKAEAAKPSLLSVKTATHKLKTGSLIAVNIFAITKDRSVRLISADQQKQIVLTDKEADYLLVNGGLYE